jgi:nucleoid-associated protein YgaU
MGLFNFNRDAGEHRAAAPAAAPQAAELAQALHQSGVTIEGGRIDVKGDHVSITGRASSQAEKEKAVLLLGNTRGVAVVEDHIEVVAPAAPAQAPAQAQARFYTVKSGDSLSKIAAEVYGDANAWRQIFDANQPLLKDPDKIYPGQALRIPQH